MTKQNRELQTAHHADYAQIAKAYVRIGNAHLKKGETEEHLTAAIDAYEGAQMENRTKDAERKIKALQVKLRKAKELAYIDPEKALAAKNEGNGRGARAPRHGRPGDPGDPARPGDAERAERLPDGPDGRPAPPAEPGHHGQDREADCRRCAADQVSVDEAVAGWSPAVGVVTVGTSRALRQAG
ncbi:hypothetical protein PF011_g27329 [Phytophthora fragariae]|uniref:Uncharacterized protein n=1 Tax=Phytophthora fragariae TaxID=53985 RepID=A0A6A3HFR7_9STRA|nr:hypothetical protein PF011_g27329 [Phytophthora fragariae]